MPYVLPSHWTDAAGPASTSSSASSFSAPLSSRSQPASANSGVQIVSMLIRSMFLSPAARRRTSNSREMSTVSSTAARISIVYFPPDCWAALRGGLLVRMRVVALATCSGGLSALHWSPPQAATPIAHAAAETAITPMPERLIELLSPTTSEVARRQIPTRYPASRWRHRAAVWGLPGAFHIQQRAGLSYEPVHPMHPNG